MRKPEHKAGKATAEAGEVMLDGPDGVAVSMTPNAASETADELKRAALEGKTQIEAERDRPPEESANPAQA